MAASVESRVRGDILVPFDYCTNPEIALHHAAILSRLFSLKIILWNAGKKGLPPEASGYENIRSKTALTDYLRDNQGKYAFVVISNKELRKRNDTVSDALRKVESLISLSDVMVFSACDEPVHQSYRSLLMPLDLTRESTQKVSRAIDFSAVDRSILVQVISVLFSVDDFVVNRLSRQLEEVRYSLEEKGVLCTAELVKTDETEKMGDVVTDVSSRTDTDLVLIMAQEDESQKESRLHPDVLDIISKCPAPVLTIHPS